MSNLDYIALPIEVDAETVYQAAVDFLRLNWPDWEPADGNLDAWILRAWAAEAAELREIASQVPPTIFRYFGANLVDVPPLDANPANGNSTWTMRDNAGYTINAGTQVGIRAAGDDLIPFEVVNTVVIPPGSTVTAPGAIQLIAINPGADGTSLGGVGSPVELIDPLDFVTTIVLTGATQGGQDAEDDATYLNRLRAEMTLLSPRPILPFDFAILARTVAGVHRSSAIDGYNPFHNMLSVNEASLETDTTGWAAGANTTRARSLAWAADGVASLSLTAVGAGNVSALGQQLPAVAGETWTAIATFRAATTPRACRVSFNWYSDVGGTVLISTSDGVAVFDSTSGNTQVFVTAVGPANALVGEIVLKCIGLGAGEVHYADKMSWRRGTTTDWVPGATAETGNERMVAVSMIDENGISVSSGIKGEVQAMLDAKREVNFIVNTMDPTYTPIDVTFNFKVVPGYSLVEVEADAEAAVAAYLSPSNWGRDPFAPNPALDLTWNNVPVLRYLEVAQIINNVTGVDYITSLTMRYGANAFAALDITLPGPLPLTQAGAINGTAS